MRLSVCASVALGGFLAAASSLNAATIAANFDPETVDVDSMSYIRPTNSYFIGAHEDSLGTGGNKPIWTTTIFFSPDQDDVMGRVSVAVRARQQRNVRMELFNTNDTDIDGSFIAPDAANLFTYLGKSIIEADDVTTGKTILDFDFDPIELDADDTYALKLTMDTVGGAWSSGSFDWLGVLGDAVPYLLDSALPVPQQAVVPDGAFGAPLIGPYGFGTLTKGSFNIGPSFAVQTPVAVPAPASALMGLLGMTLIGTRRG